MEILRQIFTIYDGYTMLFYITMIFFACFSFIPQDKKYIYMKSSKTNFRGIVVLERNLVGKLEPKCDHDFRIPGQLKQKSLTQF